MCIKIRHVSLEEAKELIRNKFWKRLSVFSFLMILPVLVDEYISQGYLFDPSDITKIGTHENLIVVLMTVSFISMLIDASRGGDNGGEED